jgi:hypothetical protein
LANILREDPTFFGLLYVVGLFFPIQILWTNKMSHDSRFYCRNDYFHGIYEIASFLALATSVLYIRPLSILSDPAGNSDMFRFSLSILIAYVLSLGRLLEVSLVQRFVKNQTGLFPESFFAALIDSIHMVLSIVFVLAAAIYSGISYHNGTSSVYGVEKSKQEDGHRWLASAASDNTALKSSYNQPDYIPIWLLLGSTLIFSVSFFGKILFFSGSSVDHKA